MAKKEYKVWLDLYTGKHIIAPYNNQTYKYVVPFFSRGDLYGNIFYIEVQKNGAKLTLTTETIDVHYYIENQCEPVYTQSFGNDVNIVDGEIVLQINPAVFAFIGKVTIKITITDADERISSGEIKFDVMRGGEAGPPDSSWYKITAIYLTQAEYDALDAQGKIESDQVYIITDVEGDLLINNANTISITDGGGYYSGNTVEDALQEIGEDKGSQLYTEENYVTDGEALTASIDKLDMELKDTNDNVGDRLYTENNYVTDGETVTSSIDKLDTNLNLVELNKANKVQESWIPLTLQNGWTGTLRIAKSDNGFVSIKGELIKGTTTISTIVASFPANYFPQSLKILPVITASSPAVYQGLYLHINGNLYVTAAGSTLPSGVLHINEVYYAG